MTVTTTETTAHSPSFLRQYFFSTDHKIIGIQYWLTGGLMGILGAFLAGLIRLQLTWPAAQWSLLAKVFPVGMEGGVMKPEFYISLVTMHGTIMIFFFVSLTLVSGFGNYLIPLQLGARDMAFPFLNMLSYWIIVPAILVAAASFFVEGGAAGSGWTAYPPLSAIPEAAPGSGLGQTLWLLAVALFIASFTMGGLNYVTTILNLRTRGMSLMRMPLTIWSFLIAAVIGLLAFPALTAAAIMLLFDRHLGTSFYLPEGLYVAGQLLPNGGGSPLLWQHLFWFLGHPEVYVLILPALGVTFDVLVPFTRRPAFGYKVTVFCLLIIAFLSMVVWGHHMFVSGMNPLIGEFFSIGTLLITIPSTIIGVNMIATLWGGKLRLTSAGMFALGTICFFGVGGLGGVFLGNAAADIQLHDTAFVVGHFHFMIGGVTLLAIFAGSYFWFPKMFGKKLSETLGKIHFWLTVVPFYGIFVTMHFYGLAGAPRRYYSLSQYGFLDDVAWMPLVMSTFAFAMMAGQVLFVVNVIKSLWRGDAAEENPWEATTLEWAAPSPPPHGNWGDAVPVVHRGAYDYRATLGGPDFVPQTTPRKGG
ncbi:MAG TPA: cbb3-type cytochrome c oxidase subunit I [Vicinamibacteria bacterium]|nr:cbb3-type cytochrome c oxidase subunit I [Vicinamibacteria bacterium]